MEIFLIAHNIRSLYNVGSMFRNADAFGVSHIYLTGYTGAPPRPEISKVALGAEITVPWTLEPDVKVCLDNLHTLGVWILALESDPSFPSVATITLPHAPVALLFGNEPNGLSAELLARADARATIEMHGKKSSLNVAVASGVALYAITHRGGSTNAQKSANI